MELKIKRLKKPINFQKVGSWEEFLKVKVKLHFATVAQLVEHNLAKVRVAGSNPVCRSMVH